MKNALIGMLIQALIKVLSPEMVKSALDALLDGVEKAVENSTNEMDDKVILPLCVLIREAFNIPDND